MYRILLVDDEELVLKSLMHTVKWEDYGFKIIGTATSGKEAYDIAIAHDPDVIFTDIQMPGINGLELIRMVLDEKPGTFFVILSGYAEFAYAQKAINLGASGYCLKPFDAREIISHLEDLKKRLDNRNAQSSALCQETIPPKKKVQTVRTNETFQEVIAYVQEHYAENLSSQYLADVFHLNASYFSQLFKKETGVTCTEYITNLRIKEACELLVTTDMKVGDISARVGFQDYFYFTRVFKKALGVSPSEYRSTNCK